MIVPIHSIWGPVTDLTEIATDVFNIDAKGGGGILVPLPVARELFTEKALSFGAVSAQAFQVMDESGFQREEMDCVQYSRERQMLIPLYELLRSRKITSYEIIREYDLPSLEVSGHLLMPDYFGEFPIPALLRNDAARSTQLANGIWVVESAVGQVVMHKVVARFALSPAAIDLARESGPYLVFDGAASAVALYELRGCYPEIERRLDGEDSLYRTLCEYFPLYAAARGMPDSGAGA